MNEVIGVLKAQGAIVVDPANIPSFVAKTANDSFPLWDFCSGAEHAKGKDSRPVRPETSSRCTRTAVRARWRRKRVPSPWPACAPSMRPGTSARTKLVSSSTRTTPRCGTSVVNG